ncbi:hypothetical protein Tco_0352041 [Tanacetum coccineum]
MSTLAEYMIVTGAENHPPMLDKTMYKSWQSRMFLYLKGKKNGRMMLESIQSGPLVYSNIKENGQVCDKKYAELIEQEKFQDDYDDRVKLLMQGTELSYQERECKMYNEFDKFSSIKGDDLIACLNKAIAFMSTVVASRFPSTNNQLITSFNPRNQATIQDGRVTVQQVQGRQGEGHMARQCTKPKRLRNSAWFKEKMLLVQAQESGQVFNEEQLTFLEDPGIPEVKLLRQVHKMLPSRLMILMLMIPTAMISLKQKWFLWETITVNESLTAELQRYKELVKTFEQRFNVDLNSREKMIDSQMDDMIRDRCALKQEIDLLKQTLSKQVKEKESLFQTLTIFKKESKEKKDKYMDKEIDLENKIKELDNIVYKVGQSAQTVHMLTKPHVFL